MPEALEANRRGALTGQQQAGFSALARSNHRSSLNTAALLLAGTAILYFFASPTRSPALRAFLIVGCTVLAVVVAVRATTGADALTRDLRDSRVESTEGAIGKRRMANGRARSTFYLEVGRTRFKVSRGTYNAAPDTGYIRLFYLPLSRKIVNYEGLPDPPVPTDLLPAHLLASARKAIVSGDRAERNEARAELGAIGHAFEAMVEPPSSPAATDSARDPRPLAESIVGTWMSPVMRATFAADGKVTVSVFGTERSGRWSVDAEGRLRSDITGQMGTAEAHVSGDRLSVTLGDRTVTLARDVRA
jgi:hypothetical protein